MSHRDISSLLFATDKASRWDAAVYAIEELIHHLHSKFWVTREMSHWDIWSVAA